MSVVPKIKTIDPLSLLDRYVWVDEEGAQVSPVHESLRAAIGFINGWHERWERLIEKWGEPSGPDDFNFQSAYVPMTKSGKPPVDLKRVHVELEIREVNAEERAIVNAMLDGRL